MRAWYRDTALQLDSNRGFELGFSNGSRWENLTMRDKQFYTQWSHSDGCVSSPHVSVIISPSRSLDAHVYLRCAVRLNTHCTLGTNVWNREHLQTSISSCVVLVNTKCLVTDLLLLSTLKDASREGLMDDRQRHNWSQFLVLCKTSAADRKKESWDEFLSYDW